MIESLQPRAQDLHAVTPDQPVLHVRGEYLALISLSQIFGVEAALTQGTEGMPSSCRPKASALRCWWTSWWASTRWW